MATQILSVITEYCSIYVDDMNMSELAVTDPPLYARNMWQLLRPALAKFNHPPEMQEYIFGTESNPKLYEPEYDGTTYTATEIVPVSMGVKKIYDDTVTLDSSVTYPVTLDITEEYDASQFDQFEIKINGVVGTHMTVQGLPAVRVNLYADGDNQTLIGYAIVATMNGNIGFIAWDLGEQTIPGDYKIEIYTGIPFSIQLGEEYTGYDLCAVRYRYRDRTGNIVLVPYTSTYNPDTGEIIVDSPTELPEGSTFDIDFYKDGYFVNTLSPAMCDIIGIAFQYVWQDRFNTDWLSIVSKIEDKSFQEQNRANKMNADGMRLREIAIKFAGAMRKFEQDVYYKNTFPGGAGLKLK